MVKCKTIQYVVVGLDMTQPLSTTSGSRPGLIVSAKAKGGLCCCPSQVKQFTLTKPLYNEKKRVIVDVSFPSWGTKIRYFVVTEPALADSMATFSNYWDK